MSLSPLALVTPTVFTLMLALGLSLRPEAMHHWRTRPLLPLRVLLASCLLVPLLALLLLQWPLSHGLSAAPRYALALMAICPSAPLAMRKAGRSGGDSQLAALLQVSAALASIVTVPLLALLFRHSFQLEGWVIRPLDVALQVGQVQVLPLLLGLTLRRRLPRLAERLETPLDRLANLLLLLLLVVLLSKLGPHLFRGVMGEPAALLAMVLLIGSCLAIGWLLGGSDPREQRSTALVTAMRNPGLALLFAGRHGQGLPGLKLWVLTYLLVTVALILPLARRRRPEAP